MTTHVIGALADSLLAHRAEIVRAVHFSDETWREQIDALRKLQAVEEASGEVVIQSESLWPFLLAAGFGIQAGGGAELAERLTEGHEHAQGRLFVGVHARATRELEGPTPLAIATGDVEVRGDHLELTSTPRWVGCCECRFIADISSEAADVRHRNKLVRTIEAACRLGVAPDCRVHVTLISPLSFRNTRSRLYSERYATYEADPAAILDDLAACRLAPRYRREELQAALERLTLHWLSYDELFDELPDSDVARAITTFRDRFDWTTVL